MSTVRHHVIIVTSFSMDYEKKFHAEAKRIFGDAVTDILDSPINSYATFFIGPDGSKEGWDQSDEGDKRRTEFIEYMKKQRKEGVYGDWIEVNYGEDGKPKIERYHATI